MTDTCSNQPDSLKPRNRAPAPHQAAPLRARLSRSLGPNMRAHLFIAGLLMMPFAVYGNPVQVDGQSLIAFGIVAFWALVIESGLATLILLPTGVLIVPCFITLLAANVAVFLFAFLPLTGHFSLWILEPGVVLADALAIKLLVSGSFLEGDGVSCRRAFVASLLGNAASFFVGVIGSHAPWIVHEMGAVD